MPLLTTPILFKLAKMEAKQGWKYWNRCKLDQWRPPLYQKKSTWWLIVFLWDDSGECNYAKIADVPGELTIKDFDGIVKLIQQMEPDKAFDTLGLWIAAEGSLDRQFKMLLDKVKKWSDKIHTSFLRKHDAAYALKVTVLKKIEHCLPALNLSKSQCNALMQPILKAALPKVGNNWIFPKEVIHGPHSPLQAAHCAFAHLAPARLLGDNHRPVIDRQFGDYQAQKRTS
jgi:hypothetical protein